MSKRQREKEEQYLEQLKKIMNDFILKNYGVRLDIPVEWSGRLRVRWGYFSFKQATEKGYYNGKLLERGQVLPGTKKIVLSKKLMQARNKDMVIKIAKHEALHYALFILGKNYQDGEDDFERELRRHGLVTTSVSLEELNLKHKAYIWVCSSCKKILIAGGKTRKDYTRYISRCCDARMENKGWQYIKPNQYYIK